MADVVDPIAPGHCMSRKRIEHRERSVIRVVDERPLRGDSAGPTGDDTVVIDVIRGVLRTS